MIVKFFLVCVASGLLFDGRVSLLAGRACLSSRLLKGYCWVCVVGEKEKYTLQKV